MAIQTYTLSKPEDLLAIPAQIQEQFEIDPWWRGHADSRWKLIPAVHRPEYKDRHISYEKNITRRFQNWAPVRREKCPPRDDFADWLFIMQHYGLPTRMLDWTETFIVALFFAVENVKNDDLTPVIWALHPSRYNKVMLGEEGFLDARSKRLAPLHARAWGGPQLNQVDAAAVMPPHTDIRMLMQSGRYTIHDTDRSIEDSRDSDTYLARIILENNTKHFWKEIPGVLGINKASLFPDLPNLAAFIRDLKFK